MSQRDRRSYAVGSGLRQQNRQALDGFDIAARGIGKPNYDRKPPVAFENETSNTATDRDTDGILNVGKVKSGPGGFGAPRADLRFQAGGSSCIRNLSDFWRLEEHKLGETNFHALRRWDRTQEPDAREMILHKA